MPHCNLSSNPNTRGNAKLYFGFALALVAAICAIFYSIVRRPTTSARNREPTANKLMTDSNQATTDFYKALEKSLARRGRKSSALFRAGDKLEKRILEEYGALFVADESIELPPVCVFADHEAVERFQNSIEIAEEEIGGVRIELQTAAMRALVRARDEARRENLDITPRDGAEAARRSFADTLRLWDSRFLPALAHWTARGEIKPEDAARLQMLDLREQTTEVLALETRGFFFSKDFARSILTSVAAPGASQHLALLAFDANEFADERVRQILSKHGWFRTVNYDLPHFTFLGRDERDLPQLGLRRLDTKYGEFWIPNVADESGGILAAN